MQPFPAHVATAVSQRCPCLALSQELWRQLPMLTVLADGVWCRSSLALFQERQCHLPILTFLISTDGCTVAGRVKPKPIIITHGLQESKLVEGVRKKP